MKRKVLALVIPALLAAGAAHAAEIYNKDGNKLDLYGKVDGLHYFSSDSKKDGDQTYLRFGFKGETQINDMLTGYGQWEYNVQANNTETSSDQAWTRLAFAGIKVGDYGSFDYGRNYGVLYDVEGWTDMLPEPAATPTPMRITLWQAAPTASQPTATAISSVWWRV